MSDDRAAAAVDALELDAVLTWAVALREQNAQLASQNARLRADRAREDRRSVAIGLLAALTFGAVGRLTVWCLDARAAVRAPAARAVTAAPHAW
jgi:hypothetical protein